ncbi:DUF4190 domain-containing protein [Nocardia abscessus]|nr:DUF4190 domain-containing protein [Nocardia abscessus]
MNIATGYRTGGRPEIGVGIALLIVAASVFLWSTGRLKSSAATTGVQPIGFTETGQPVYPVVGSTLDGQPVTANQVPGGVRVASARTNTLAIVALVCGFVLAPLAIPIGHIALVQIRRTSEQGRVLAIVGLTLGYIWTTLIVIAVLVVSAGA